jgi:hypothetical protein
MSIWFAEAFVGAVLCDDGRRVGTLSEEFGDGGFIVQKGCVVICSKVHSISLELQLNRSDAKLGPARKFAIDSVSNTPGTPACRCKLLARCNCRLKSEDPVLLIFNVGLALLIFKVGLGKFAKVYFK